tara:strand:+ start:612 stop:785 length:174 start_codon:yes stop_codon:yes gene_type:complete
MEKEIIIGIVIAIIIFIIFKIKKKDEWDIFERRDKTNDKVLYKFGINRRTGEKRRFE